MWYKYFIYTTYQHIQTCMYMYAIHQYTCACIHWEDVCNFVLHIESIFPSKNRKMNLKNTNSNSMIVLAKPITTTDVVRFKFLCISFSKQACLLIANHSNLAILF